MVSQGKRDQSAFQSIREMKQMKGCFKTVSIYCSIQSHYRTTKKKRKFKNSKGVRAMPSLVCMVCVEAPTDSKPSRASGPHDKAEEVGMPLQSSNSNFEFLSSFDTLT